MKRAVFLMLCTLKLSASGGAGPQEDTDKAFLHYGEDVQKIKDKAEDALKKEHIHAESYFKNQQDDQISSGSFFGFGAEDVGVVPGSESPQSCRSCMSQTISSVGNPVSLVQKPLESSQTKKPVNPATEMLVFVSLGMPEASLKSLADEAHQTGARLIVRGLLNQSFQTTLAKIQSLNINLEIDPPLFDLFEIERVPTFVRCKTSPEGPVKAGHDRLKGNVPLAYAWEQLIQGGDLT